MNRWKSKREVDLRVLSLGGGVQSTTLYLLACDGLIGPRPDVAIFADTGAEPDSVYQHLDRLDADHGGEIPIHRVSAGDLASHVMDPTKGRRQASVPFFVRGDDGTTSAIRRTCTASFKVEPIFRHVRELLGLKKGQRAVGKYLVEDWVGISTDEAHRMKDSREAWIVKEYPLLELRMSRGDCLRWMREAGYPRPSKSACWFCPYHDDVAWARLQEDEPDAFAKACELDAKIRNDPRGRIKSEQFIHRSLRPLSEIDFVEERDRQYTLDLGFGNECEGMCGV